MRLISTNGYNPVTALGDFTVMMLALVLAASAVVWWYLKRRH